MIRRVVNNVKDFVETCSHIIDAAQTTIVVRPAVRLELLIRYGVFKSSKTCLERGNEKRHANLTFFSCDAIHWRRRAHT